MSISVSEPVATRAWCDDDSLWLELADGRRLAVPLAFYPRLLHATPEQRARYELSGGGRGLHSEELDEDLSVAGLLAGIPNATQHAHHTGQA
ncbi:MAG TPA: DUF2442 domain-containing protein [Tepidiformaceae bacterium]|nr:DUF2442 domain-containing protein [Tepidiformaceae bacterium]